MKPVKNNDKSNKIKAGDILKTKQGYDALVIEYIDCKNVIIEFQDEHKHRMRTQAGHLKRGIVKNPYHPSIFDIGFLGSGKWKSNEGIKPTPEYKCWVNMLKRAYYEKYHTIRPTYIGVKVCKGWHNFQNFAEWYNNQPNSNRQGFALDKDLKNPCSREYNPENCTFVPQAVNSLFTNSDHTNSSGMPTGVSIDKKKYKATVSIDSRRVYIGNYDTPEEAHEAYRKEKRKEVKRIAEQYKDDLDHQVYRNLMEWE